MHTLSRYPAAVLTLVLLPQMLLAAGFSDVPADAWYANDVQIAQSKGWVSGYKDADGRDLNRFGPQDIVTIGQALKVTQLAAGRTSVESGCANCHWAEQYKAEAAEDYIELNLKTLDRHATRSEVVAMVANAFRLEGYHNAYFKGGEGGSSGVTDGSCKGNGFSERENMFSDVPASFRLCAVIAHLSLLNVIHGDDVPAGSPKVFRPHDAISRAEFVRIVANAWAALSKDSPYAKTHGPVIEVSRILGSSRYELYEGGGLSLDNNTDVRATIEVTPPMFRGGDALMIIEPKSRTGYSFTEEAVLGEHAFVIRHNGKEFRGTILIAPDPLKRGW